jgi:fatty acid elongase 3
MWQHHPADYPGLSSWAMYIFYLSKFPELIDTVILVLKKKNIIFLHWYHHAIVILMVFGWCEAKMGVTIFGLMFNTFVHIWMYWYYFAACLGWNVWYKKYITTMQIVQFICSFLISIPFLKVASITGYHSWSVWIASNGINFSFLLLFIKFYLDNYKKKPAAGKKGSKQVKEAKESKPSPKPSPRSTPRKKNKK